MSDKPILFYSPKCVHSINLWKTLKVKNMLDKIIKINVNNTKSIPKNVRSTPTLLVANRAPIVGKSIELFLNSNSVTVGRTSNKPNQQTQQIPNQQTVLPNAGSIQDYMPGEMSGAWSDNYSFIDNNNPISHSFEWLNASNSINTSNQQPVQNKQDKNNVIEQRLELLKKKRNMDMSNNRNF